MHENPFRIGAHVSGDFFTDRADEVRRILRAMQEPTRLLILGPRRMGKSSAVAVATGRARRKGVLVVRADLSTTSGLVDVANRLLHSLSDQRKRGWLTDFAAELAPSASVTFDGATGTARVMFGVERRTASREEQRESLDRVVAALAREAEGDRRVAVVLDEFQAVRRFGGEEAEWHLRGLMQGHPPLSFVCAGSEVSVIQGMLTRERAFFRTFELLSMGPVDAAHLARWIDDRLGTAGVEADGVGAEAIRLVGPRTQDVVQVARHVWARSMSSGRALAGDVKAAAEDVVREEDPVIRSIWVDLTANQQNVLRAVASGMEQLFSSATRRRFGLPTSSTVATAVDALVQRGLLVRDPETASIVFDSPFVQLWVEQEAGGDVPPAS